MRARSRTSSGRRRSPRWGRTSTRLWSWRTSRSSSRRRRKGSSRSGGTCSSRKSSRTARRPVWPEAQARQCAEADSSLTPRLRRRYLEKQTDCLVSTGRRGRMSLKSQARQRLGRLAGSSFLSGGLLAAAGCASTLRQIDLYKSGSVQVSLREVVESGHSRPQGYGHPASLAPEKVRSMLGAVGFEEFAYFAWHDKGPLFTEDELSQLAPKLAEGLQKATADQWVYFSVSGMRGWRGLF